MKKGTLPKCADDVDMHDRFLAWHGMLCLMPACRTRCRGSEHDKTDGSGGRPRFLDRTMPPKREVQPRRSKTMAVDGEMYVALVVALRCSPVHERRLMGEYISPILIALDS